MRKNKNILKSLLTVLIAISIALVLITVFHNRNRLYYYPDIHSYFSIKRPLFSPYDYVCFSRDRNVLWNKEDYIKIRKAEKGLSYFALIIDPHQDSVINYVDNADDVAGFHATHYEIRKSFIDDTTFYIGGMNYKSGLFIIKMLSSPRRLRGYLEDNKDLSIIMGTDNLIIVDANDEDNR